MVEQHDGLTVADKAMSMAARASSSGQFHDFNVFAFGFNTPALAYLVA
jgi:hypothetical protein